MESTIKSLNETKSQQWLWLALSVGAAGSLLPKDAIASPVALNQLEEHPAVNLQALTKSPKLLKATIVDSPAVALKKKVKPTISTIINPVVSPSVNHPETEPSPSTALNPALSPSISDDYEPRPTALVKVAKPKVSGSFHLVKPGDTLNEIAAHYGVDPKLLVTMNHITNPDIIEVNQKLYLPQPQTSNQKSHPIDTHQYASQIRADVLRLREDYQTRPQPVSLNKEVKREDNPQSLPLDDLALEIAQLREQKNSTLIASRSQLPETNPEINTEELAVINSNIPELPPLLPSDQYLPETPLEFNGYIWPAQGLMTSGYGWRWGRLHRGIDIAGPVGTPIFAAASGEVIWAGWNSQGFGNLVKIKHADGSLTVYAHNSRILVIPGQVVEQGQQIAEMGNTGYSTGPHLHFEVHPYQKGAVNPIAYLPRK